MELYEDPLVKSFLQSRNLKEGTEIRYLRALTHYSKFIKMPQTIQPVSVTMMSI